MVKFRSVMTALVAFLAGQAIAHPGEHHTSAQKKREAADFRSVNTNMARALERCRENPEYITRQEQAIARRANAAETIREKRGYQKKPVRCKRDQAALDKWMGISHNHTDLCYNLETPREILFGGNSTCALHSETILGPYWVEGEYVRSDIAEDQPGVPLHLDIQIVDVNTCLPVPEMVVDIWHCNATGIYSGVAAAGQGGLDTTWARGAQISDKAGIVEFDTIFPGHYGGRAVHIHILATKNAHIYRNHTHESGLSQHIGQFFFDQSLVDAIETTEPYTQNQQADTLNADDFIAADAATDEYDVFMDYALLGEEPADGVISWVMVGIDTSANYTNVTEAAAHYYEEGGVDLTDGEVMTPPAKQ